MDFATRPELAAHAFFNCCKRLVQDMLRLKKRRGKLKAADYWRRGGASGNASGRTEPPAVERCRCRSARRASAQVSNETDDVPAKEERECTNNAVERALRPAVVMRKITDGSRNEAGVQAWAILASVMRTAEQQGKNVLETIKTLLRAEWAGKDIALQGDRMWAEFNGTRHVHPETTTSRRNKLATLPPKSYSFIDWPRRPQ